MAQSSTVYSWSRTGLALASSALAAAAPVLAQPSAPATDPIVVTGRAPGESAQDAARGFVQDISAEPVSGQFARWKAPVCVKVVGLSYEDGATVAARIMAIAKEAKVRLGKPGCKTNLLVAFTDDANALVNEMASQKPRRFFELTTDERRLLMSSALPVRWLYDTRTEGVDGHRFGGESAALLGANVEGSPGGPGINSREGGGSADGYNSSLVGTRIRVIVEGAVVMVDVNLTTGRTLDSVAAFTAMVTLARIKLGSQTADNQSILALFTPGVTPPEDLSLSDRAYLAALYRVPANRDARVQERAIAAQMVKLIEADATETQTRD